MRAVLLIHRYLGIAVGVLMVSWCLSGFVMMYASYPTLTEAQRLAALPRLDWSFCPGAPRALPSDPAHRFCIEMLAHRPVLREERAARSPLRDLCTGDPLPRVSTDQASSVASRVPRRRAARCGAAAG